MWRRGLLPRLPGPHLFVDFLRSDSANCHILAYGDPRLGPMTHKFELGWDFCTMHLTNKFHNPTFNRSEVIVLTNKQTNRRRWKHPPRSAMLRWWVGLIRSNSRFFSQMILFVYCIQCLKFMIMLRLGTCREIQVLKYLRTRGKYLSTSTQVPKKYLSMYLSTIVLKYSSTLAGTVVTYTLWYKPMDKEMEKGNFRPPGLRNHLTDFHETSWNFLGSRPLVGRSSPYSEEVWGDIAV